MVGLPSLLSHHAHPPPPCLIVIALALIVIVVVSTLQGGGGVVGTMHVWCMLVSGEQCCHRCWLEVMVIVVALRGGHGLGWWLKW